MKRVPEGFFDIVASRHGRSWAIAGLFLDRINMINRTRKAAQGLYEDAGLPEVPEKRVLKRHKCRAPAFAKATARQADRGRVSCVLLSAEANRTGGASHYGRVLANGQQGQSNRIRPNPTWLPRSRLDWHRHTATGEVRMVLVMPQSACYTGKVCRSAADATSDGFNAKRAVKMQKLNQIKPN